MAIKVLVARQMRDRFRFVLHLDDTKTVRDPDDPAVPPNPPTLPLVPDPRWLLRREWPLKEGGQKAAYLQAIRDELRDAAVERIAQLTDEDAGGTALAIEGQTITP